MTQFGDKAKKKKKRTLLAFQGSECHCFYEKLLSEAFLLPNGCLNVFFIIASYMLLALKIIGNT